MMEEEEEEGAEEQQRFSYRQRLKAAVHYTVGCLCEEVASDKEMQFSKQTIAAISEVTFRQCENFAKDLEMFARHAKRSTINTEDVKLLARRSNSLRRDPSPQNPDFGAAKRDDVPQSQRAVPVSLQDAATPLPAAAAAAAALRGHHCPSPGGRPRRPQQRGSGRNKEKQPVDFPRVVV
ncbi:centromere protein S isoform X5 [Hippopotamus amphibius kiboko]|uniref:centromere protein S isoform X5 n=1 Tax=Hippopotamus amphibius kiboko TaxID=575201 RepID=UPI00259A6003|nr:centromere protein S isoform X5 [Hippopotamus amphibius kiboko]